HLYDRRAQLGIRTCRDNHYRKLRGRPRTPTPVKLRTCLVLPHHVYTRASCHGYDRIVLATLVSHTLSGVAYRHSVMRTVRGSRGRFSSLYGTTTLRLPPEFPYPPGGPGYERLV